MNITEAAKRYKRTAESIRRQCRQNLVPGARHVVDGSRCRWEIPDNNRTAKALANPRPLGRPRTKGAK